MLFTFNKTHTKVQQVHGKKKVQFHSCPTWPQLLLACSWLAGGVLVPMTDPWDDCILTLHEWLILMVNVGIYTIHGWYIHVWYGVGFS